MYLNALVNPVGMTFIVWCMWGPITNDERQHVIFNSEATYKANREAPMPSLPSFNTLFNYFYLWGGVLDALCVQLQA